MRGRRLWWSGAALILGALALTWAARLQPSPPADASDDYCEQVRSSFERTSLLARDLATILESFDVEGPAATAERLGTVRQGLEHEASTLASSSPPAGAEEVPARALAAVGLLLTVADPHITDAAGADRGSLVNYVREQFTAARTEARAATAALRQMDSGCPNRRSASGAVRLMSRRGDGAGGAVGRPQSGRASSIRAIDP